MRHLPNLSCLGLCSASQVTTTTTGGNADGKKPARVPQPGTAQSSYNEFPYDLITTVLTTLRNDDVEESCRTVARWCRLNKTHQKACMENPNLWATLLHNIFPDHPPGDDPAVSEGTFFSACWQWQERKMAATARRKESATSKMNRRKYDVHKSVLEFRDERERDLSALMQRAEDLLVKSKTRGYDGAINNDLRRLVRDAIDDVFLARNPDIWFLPSSWEGAPERFERLAARLNTLTRTLQAKMDERARYLGVKPTFPDGPPRPQPMQVDTSGAGPSNASSDDEEGEPYNSEDEPATPPGFHG